MNYRYAIAGCREHSVNPNDINIILLENEEDIVAKYDWMDEYLQAQNLSIELIIKECQQRGKVQFTVHTSRGTYQMCLKYID